MAGLAPAIYAGTREDSWNVRASVSELVARHGVDARDKRGHDGRGYSSLSYLKSQWLAPCMIVCVRVSFMRGS